MFATKLGLVLKALSLSRGQLAVELAVDKSVVSRWLSGTRQPTSSSMAALTSRVAMRAPGFATLDWDLGVEDFTLRVRELLARRERGEAAPEQVARSVSDWLDIPKLNDAFKAAGPAGRAAAGFWRATAPMPGAPGHYGQSYSMQSVEGDGSIRVETGFFTLRRVGWAVAIGNQFFGCVTGMDDGYFAFTIFNRVPGPSLDVMDGLFMGCLADNGGVPICLPVVMERIGELTHTAVDQDRLGELLMSNPVVPAASVTQAIRDRLASAPSPDAAMLMMPALTALAASRTPKGDANA